jgi:hypothetical protein
MQEKLLFCINGKCLFLQGVPEHGLNKSLGSFSSLLALSLYPLLYSTKEIKLIFYMRGLFELFPPISPTLFNYIEWAV